MPVKVVKRGDNYRVVEASSGRLAKNAGGTPVSKGFKSKGAAQRQANAINANTEGKRKKN